MPAHPRLTPAVLALALGGLVSTALWAETAPPPEPGEPAAPVLDLFAAADADADGMLTPEELAAHRAARFAAADANGDGALDAAEVTAWQRAEAEARLAARAARLIERQDDNGDGALSAAELGESPVEARFARIDTDDDGRITLAEAEAAAERMARRHKRGHGPGQD
jgi:Ca2+-binding EF-hand superfamily protein